MPSPNSPVFRVHDELRLDIQPTSQGLDTIVTQLVLKCKNYALARQWSNFTISVVIMNVDALKVQVFVSTEET